MCACKRATINRQIYTNSLKNSVLREKNEKKVTVLATFFQQVGLLFYLVITNFPISVYCS